MAACDIIGLAPAADASVGCSATTPNPKIARVRWKLGLCVVVLNGFRIASTAVRGLRKLKRRVGQNTGDHKRKNGLVERLRHFGGGGGSREDTWGYIAAELD